MNTILRTGFIEADIDSVDTFYPVEDESVLQAEEYQAVLRRHHLKPKSSRSGLFCCCRGSQHQLRLTPRLLPNGAEGIAKLTLVRDDMQQHSSDCWRGLILESSDGSARISDSIFKCHSSNCGVGSGTATEFTEAEGGRLISDFSRAFTRIFADAQVELLAKKNLTWARDGLRGFGVSELFEQIHRELLCSRCASSNLYGAASAEGVDLRFGIISRTAWPCESARGVLVNGQWFEDGVFVSETLAAPPAVWNDGLGRVHVFGKTIAGPYLAFAAVEPTGSIRRMTLYPVWANGGTIRPVESGYERGFFSHINRADSCVLKPLLCRDVNELVKKSGLSSHWDIPPIPYRPDFVEIFLRDSAICGCRIYEVRGIRPGKIPEYDKLLERKAAFYSSLDPRIVEYAEKDGWDYASLADLGRCSAWDEMELGWRGRTPAAQALANRGSGGLRQ